jgi:molybdopterin synthase sulfur carrier subunit
MQVVVRTIGPFSDKMGFQQLTIQLTGHTVSDLLQQLCKERGDKFRNVILDEKGNLRSYVKLLVNGRGLHLLEGLKTVLADGDVVAIFPPVAGGSHRLRCRFDCLGQSEGSTPGVPRFSRWSAGQGSRSSGSCRH